MSTARTRPCRRCGNPTKAFYCGRCVAAKRAQNALGHVYQRTHVHVWGDGHRTIELGQECRGESEGE